MMRFDWCPPDMLVMRGIRRGDTLHPCWNCGRLTRYFDIDFGAWLCSNLCQDAKWMEFQKTYGGIG